MDVWWTWWNQWRTGYIVTWKLFIYHKDNMVWSTDGPHMVWSLSSSDDEERDEEQGETRVTRWGRGKRGDGCWAGSIREEGVAVLVFIGCCFGWRWTEEHWVDCECEAPHDSPFKQLNAIWAWLQNKVPTKPIRGESQRDPSVYLPLLLHILATSQWPAVPSQRHTVRNIPNPFLVP